MFGIQIAALLALLSWLVVPRINHALAIQREREAREQVNKTAKDARRLEFIGFLKRWRAEVFSPNPKNIHPGPYRPDASVVAHQERLLDFHAQIALVQDDFPDRQRFDSLTQRLAGLNYDDWQKEQPRDVICKAIDEFVHFMES